MFRTTVKEERFFDMFIALMDKIHKSAEALLGLMNNYSDVQTKIALIRNIEHECDLDVHNILEALNLSFITPIDREDIFLIAKELDNIIDAIETTAHRFKMFDVHEIRKESLTLVKIIVQSTNELKNIFNELKNLKRSKTLKEMIIEVNRFENEGDDVYRVAIENLFINEKDAIEVIKWKEIFDYLENSLDACEDVANIIEGVVMKYA